MDENGRAWESEMHNTYGYFRGTEGKDRGHIDVFLGENPLSENVFVVDQVNPETGEFDEHKVMMGFNTVKEAREAYLSNYEKDWKGLGGIAEVNIDDFRDWAKMEGRRIKPFMEYKSIQPEKSHVPDKKLRPVSKQAWENLIDRLKQTGLARNVTVDKSAMREYLDKHPGKDGAERFMAVVEDATDKQIQVNGQWYARSINPGWASLKVGDHVTELNENKLQQKKQKTIDSKLIEAAKKEFGITDNFKEAGYLLPDGTMLDFSGKRNGTKGGYRTEDHREISNLGDDVDLVSIMAMGNIRLSPGSGGFKITGKPTAEQMRTLRRYIHHFGGDVMVNFSPPGSYGAEHGVEYYETNSERVINDIINYYENGIKPITRLRLMATSKGEVYGFTTPEGDVYLAPDKMNANTPIHEFGHLFWSAAMPAEMKAKITELLKQTPGWKNLSTNSAYANLKTDDQKADELFNTLLGNYGEYSPQVRAITGDNISLFARIQNAINEFLEWLKATVFKNTDAKLNVFAKKTLGELLSGSLLNSQKSNNFAENNDVVSSNSKCN